MTPIRQVLHSATVRCGVRLSFGFIGSAVILGAGCTEQAAFNPTPVPPTPPTVAVTEVTVAGPDTASGSVQLTASAALSDGTHQDVTALAHWETSDVGVATVTPSGMLVPTGSGRVEARAAYRTFIGTHTLLVTTPPAPPKYVVSGVRADEALLSDRHAGLRRSGRAGARGDDDGVVVGHRLLGDYSVRSRY